MNAGAHDESGRAVVVEERGPFAVLRLNRPAERNPLSVSTLDALERLFSSLAARAEVHAVIITGAADVFASGADIRELSALSAESARAFAERGQRLFRQIEEARPLTVAAVNGFCMGGGLDLALACRLRVAAPGAVFAHPGARLGIITGWGGTQRLPRFVGDALAFEMLLAGRRLSGSEAFAAGLVHHLSEQPLERARELALAAR
ncbi:MAG TPA: enoyl-CoA hydratase/isomerase family protein [Pyrinomonadaceae bacterium]|nr:enoyl-CoA hydratase/isomerase family protein [Pyrinomonadaceae bacterium]